MAEPLEIARLATERWNAGDLEGVVELYAEDAVMHAGPDWPEQQSWHGRDGIRRNMEDWHEVWESSQIEVKASKTTASAYWPEELGTRAGA